MLMEMIVVKLVTDWVTRVLSKKKEFAGQADFEFRSERERIMNERLIVLRR